MGMTSCDRSLQVNARLFRRYAIAVGSQNDERSVDEPGGKAKRVKMLPRRRSCI